MRSNKVSGLDIFTCAANERYYKHVKTQSKRTLDEINRRIDWKALAKPIEKRIEKYLSKESDVGRKRYDIIVIIKCFILQHMYDLSDPRLEEEIADRRSFQIFLDIKDGDSIPDETTLCRYRELFAQLNLDELLFKRFNEALRRMNLIIDKGTIVDATIKEAQAKPKSKRDKDARFAKRGEKTYYGYKGHIAIDKDTEIIKEAKFTPANEHDVKQFENLVDYSEQEVYADKGYCDEKLRRKLKDKKIFDGIMARARRCKPLSEAQNAFNKMLAKIRNKVERPFAYMKRILGYDRCRYYDIRRNRFEFIIKCLIYNIRKLITYARANYALA